jgi:tRNA 2-selenouridine synthase
MQVLSTDEFLKQSKDHLCLDVRSPKEFNQGHLPHAINLPLFDDKERAKVGTAYKQQGRQTAIELGLQIVGPKMAEFARFVKPLAPANKVFVHCWRGGMRSGSVAWMFDLLGYEVYTLKGGYKAYRNHVLTELGNPSRYVVIGGFTGSGKTAILHHLVAQGEQVIDLERLAHHKGSAFGALLEDKAPSSEQFENNLHQACSALDLNKTIWLEDESRHIGSCYLPLGFWQQMRASPLLIIDVPAEERLAQVMLDYSQAPTDDLIDSFQKIERRLGNEAMKTAIAHLQDGDKTAAAAIALRYYDKTYTHSLSLKDTKDFTSFSFPKIDVPHIAQTLLDHVHAR